MPLPRTEMSAPKTGYFGTDPGFKSGVGAIFGRNRRRDSPLCSRHLLPGPGRSPPPITGVGGSSRERYVNGGWQDERGSQRHQRLLSIKGAPPPVTPCAAQVPFRLCLRQSPGTASVRWCGLRYALPSARLATPRLLPGAATPTGQQAGDFESPHGSQNRPTCSRRLW